VNQRESVILHRSRRGRQGEGRRGQEGVSRGGSAIGAFVEEGAEQGDEEQGDKETVKASPGYRRTKTAERR